MKERPILFNPEMVRAIMDGRKTQTRRIVKPQPAPHLKWAGFICESSNRLTEGMAQWADDLICKKEFQNSPCPFGKPGDRLWVRETWGWFAPNWDGIEWVPDRPFKKIHELKVGKGYADGNLIWRADGEFTWACEDSMEERSAWHPSIHMPREASRITLEIKNVRVERLHDISEKDAKAEGVKPITFDNPKCPHGFLNYLSPSESYGYTFAYNSFESLWESINGEESWKQNPWVWVIEFERVIL